MNKKEKSPILGIIIAIVISFFITFFNTNDVFSESKTPTEAYRVYLKGEPIGLIKSEDELNDYINKQQQAIKEKYNASKVYIPNDIKVVKDITYDDNLMSVGGIYNLINEQSPFTIKGYVVTIDKTNTTEYVDDAQVESDEKDDDDEPKIIYVNILDKQMFEDSVMKTILSFISNEEYEAFINEEQVNLTGPGEVIEDLYIEDMVTIKEAYIPVNEKIYTDSEELTRYLLFGQNNEMSSYTVKADDTIATVAEENKMSVNELLIANTNLKSSTSLLYEGQKLVIGVLDPIFTTVEEKHIVEDQTIEYKTEIEYDNTKMVGYQAVKVSGSNGTTRVTQKVKLVNGEIVNALISSSEEIKPVVNEVIVKGGRKPVIVSAGSWVWPTNIPYIISSQYGWRWGTLHRGVDISGTGYGSPIYAAKSGVVTEVNYHYLSGNYVVIDHQNGYYTRYAHMASLSPYVKVGDYVNAGATIGDMGSSGRSNGTHLHFELWYGKPYAGSSQCYNPMLFY